LSNCQMAKLLSSGLVQVRGQQFDNLAI